MTGPVRVLVAEDEEPLLYAIRDLIASEPGLEVVATAASGAEAVALAESTTPHVALIDVRMPGGGAEAARGILAVSPRTRVLALSAYDDQATVLELLRAGAVGYLVKGIAPVEILEAVRRAARGQASLPIQAIAGVMNELAADTAERRAADEIVRRSDRRWRDLLESAPDAVVIIDEAGTIVLVNAQTEEVFGYPRNELVGMPAETLLPERSHERYLRNRAAYLDDRRTRPPDAALELTGRRQDGTEFPADISLSAIDDGDGRLLAVRVRDLSEWRQADDVRRKSEERLAALLESAPDAVAIVDAHGRIVLVNAQTEKLFGYERDELLESSIDLLLPRRLREQHAHHRDVYMAEPVTRPMGIYLDLFGCRKDGTEFPVDVSLSALETDDGLLVTAFIRDVTDRKAEENVQRLREGWLGDLLESAPDAVVVSDEGGRIVLVNKQTEKLFGYRREELTGRPIETLVPERVRAPHAGDLAGSEAPGMGEGLELAGLRKDGSEFPIEISLSTIETEQGRLVTSFVRDVTERLAREELERDLAERRALLAHLVSAGEEERSRIADDIHDDSIQAITAAGMRLQILRRSLDDPEQLALLGELEQTIQLSIARLRNLLFELRPPVLDNEGLSAALEMYLDVAEGETETTYRLEDRLRVQPPAETRTILYRIVLEALANARKHAAAGTVTVSLDQSDGGYLVRVADDGVGFAVEESMPVPGHLGLAAMRERALLAGGRLRIEAAPGSGTAVEVWIPDASQPGASEPFERGHDRGSSSSGRAA